jgi:lambda repressor-like predicted transcriptional regulator
MTRHGTYGAYSTGCRCDPCTEAGRAYAREWEQDMRWGIKRWVPVQPARDHVALLCAQGMSLRAIAAVAGLSTEGLSYSVRKAQKIRRGNADLILAVTVDDIGPRHRVPADTAVARVSAMRRAGISGIQIARMLGLRSNAPRVGEYRTIEYRTHRRIEVLYGLLVRCGDVPATLGSEEAA